MSISVWSLHISLFSFIKKREGGKGREYDTPVIPFLLLKKREQGGKGRGYDTPVIPFLLLKKREQGGG